MYPRVLMTVRFEFDIRGWKWRWTGGDRTALGNETGKGLELGI